MSMELTLTVHPFRADCTDKEAALKPLEEASEVYSAWQEYDPHDKKKWCGDTYCDACDIKDGCADYEYPLEAEYLLGMLADELADTITACANMAYRYGIDMQTALDRCEQKNRERGGYDDDEVAG